MRRRRARDFELGLISTGGGIRRTPAGSKPPDGGKVGEASQG